MNKCYAGVVRFALLCALPFVFLFSLWGQSTALRAADRIVVTLAPQPLEGPQKVYFSISEGDQVSLESPTSGRLTLGKKENRKQAVSLELPSGVTSFSLVGSLREFFIPYRAKDENTPKVAALDLKGAPRLLTLSCVGNDLTSLDLSKNTSLAYLFCDANPIAELDLSGLPDLTSLSVSDLRLKRLDLSANPKVAALGIGGNPFDQDFDIYAYSSLPLLQLACDRLGLEEFDCRKFPALEMLYIHGNKLKSMGDLRPLRSLLHLSIGDNPLRDFDESRLPHGRLRSLYCFGLGISSLDLSGFPYINKVDCSNNQLTHLKVDRCDNLEVLRCGRNALTELDLTSLWLKELQCDRNQLSAILLSDRANLQKFSCYGNRLSLGSMEQLVERLLKSSPEQSPRVFTPFTTRADVPEYNVCSKSLVDKARAAGWEVRVVTGVDAEGREVTEDFEGSPIALEPTLQPSVAPYPNPTRDYLLIENLSPNTWLYLYAASGECVQQTKVGASGRVELSLSHLLVGSYFLRADEGVFPILIER